MFKLILFLVFLVFGCAADQFDNECGLESPYAVPLIKNGIEVKKQEFPWYVAIFKWYDGQYEVVCGGSLIKNDLVISAAHCFADATGNVANVGDYKVAAGSRLSSWTSEEHDRQTSEVRNVRLGQGYRGNAGNYYADIAIVQLRYSFILTEKVHTICMQLGMGMDNWHRRPGHTGKVAGWGLTEWEIPSNTLKFLPVRVIGNELCASQTPANYRRYLIPDKVCASLKVGSSVCQGDSGGGLVLRRDGRWFLFGVLSTAPNMENPDYLPTSCPRTTIALYTNIQKHSSWLSKNLRELHRPAYTRPGTACNVTGATGVCQEYLNCPTAVEAVGFGFPPKDCPNSDPTGLMICCVSTEKAVERGLKIGQLLQNAKGNDGLINGQPRGAITPNATARTGSEAACYVKESIGVCREYLVCPTAVRAAGLGYPIRDMKRDCPNSGPTGTMICCISKEKADENGHLIGVVVNIQLSQLYAGSSEGEPRGTWTPSAIVNTAQESQLLPSGASETMASPIGVCCEAETWPEPFSSNVSILNGGLTPGRY